MSTAVHQLMEMEREEIKQMVTEEVEKQISIAMKNCKVSQIFSMRRSGLLI